jgi:hypothetical protein
MPNRETNSAYTTVCLDLYEELAARRCVVTGEARMNIAIEAAKSVYQEGMTQNEWFLKAKEKLP